MSNQVSDIVEQPQPSESVEGPGPRRPSAGLPAPASGVLARLSLEHKLPLIIGTLLLGVIIALSAAAYVEVRSTQLRIASDRLTSVTTQFRDLFQQSGGQLRAQTAVTATKPSIAEFVKTGSARARAAALADLKYTGPNPDQVLATELRDSTGAVLLSTAKEGLGVDTMAVNDVLPRNEPGDSAVIGQFRRLRDTIVFAMAAPVSGAANAYVVRWRRLVTSRRSREQMSHLIGSDATIFFGNPGGKHWTDLEHPTAAPPVDPAGGMIQTYERGPDRTKYLAAQALVPNSPWILTIDFPMRQVMGPVDSFLQKMAIIAAIALLLGLIAAWLFSRRITNPLGQLTEAAVTIASGKNASPLRIARSDELGLLGRAFTTMATEVGIARTDLERKVDERTRDLNQTMRQLHDAQDALVRRERLAMLGQLSSGVGHELRNPLGVMTNAVYYLKAVLGAQPTTVHEYLDILQQQITLSEKIVSDLLDFARSKPPQRKPTSVAEVTRAQIERLAATNGVRIDTQLPNELPLVLVDKVQLGQIVLNLVTNAMQAMEGKGLIVIRADGNDHRVNYEVTDSGPGIARENLEKIFEPLFTTKARGIGLGLAVSRTLARANGGDLTVTSTPGNGATFRLTLPIAEHGGMV